MKDPYRDSDPASLQDDVRRLGEKLEKAQLLAESGICGLKTDLGWIDGNVRLLKRLMFCVLIPIVALVFPVIVGALQSRESVLQERLWLLQRQHDVQTVQLRELQSKVGALWHLDLVDMKTRTEEVAHCPYALEAIDIEGEL